MGLTATDSGQIKNIVRVTISLELTPIKDELEMIRNDIKETYFTIAGLQNSTITDKQLKKLSLEKKLLTLNAELISAAKQAGITFPRP